MVETKPDAKMSRQLNQAFSGLRKAINVGMMRSALRLIEKVQEMKRARRRKHFRFQ